MINWTNYGCASATIRAAIFNGSVLLAPNERVPRYVLCAILLHELIYLEFDFGKGKKKKTAADGNINDDGKKI